ncbi:hypothetical protein RQP46_006499 [Phenoliferia psychrophenolica]
MDLNGGRPVRRSRIPSLSIDTESVQHPQSQFEAPPLLLPSPGPSPFDMDPPEQRKRSGSFGLQNLNPLRTSTSVPDQLSSPGSPSGRGASAAAGRAKVAPNTSKGKGEERKLLTYLLSELRRATSQAGGVFGAAGGHKGKAKAAESESEDEEDDSARTRARRSRAPDWGTQTFDLMTRFRDLLVLAERMHWDIFLSNDANDDWTATQHDPTTPTSPSSPRGRFMRSGSQAPPSPTSPTAGQPVSGSSLFTTTVQVLGDIALLASTPLPAFRPAMPPLSLQSITLDVATLLLKTTQGRPRDSVAVAFSMLAALQGWGEGMMGRVIVFFDSFVTESLERLARHTGAPARNGALLQAATRSVPAIAIQLDEPDLMGGASAAEGGALDIGDRAAPSSMAGDLPLVVYELTALVAPLLTVALASISPLRSSMATLYRLHKMIESLVVLKPDLYLDLLDTVAYGSSADRRAALSILTSFWPKALGQPSIAQPFPPVSYRDDVYRLETQTMRLPSRASEHVAHLVPWRFDCQGSHEESSRPASATFASDGLSSSAGDDAQPCIECGLPVVGFGLLSLSGPYEALHLRCHNSPEGSFIAHYVTPNNTNRIAAPRFSVVPAPRRAGLVPAQVPAEEKSMPPISIRVDSHRFRLVSIFTLVPCFVCRMPLWGATAQGYKCASCRQFAHHKCLTDPNISPFPPCEVHESTPIEHITIDHKVLRRDFLAFYRDVVFDEKRLAAMSYEEVSVFHMVLWTQQQLLDAGVAGGTIVVQQTGPTKQAREAIDPFELHWLAQLYGAYKDSQTMRTSTALREFRAMHGESLDESDAADDVAVSADPDCFSLPLLVFVTALMRSPVEDPNPDPTFPFPGSQPAPGRCFEQIQVSLMLEILTRDFGLRSPVAARHFLEHLLHLGLFERQDARLLLLPQTSTISPRESSTTVIFPLPFLIDPSPSVESLVVAIESSLRDVDLSVQEAGLLLLFRRCWPSPFASAYALERLTRAVLQWLLDDTTLLAVTREHVASLNKRYNEAGRSAPQHSTMGSSGGGGSGGSGGGGADYVLQRKLLVERLAARWLRALHDLDPQQYGEFLFRQTAIVSAASDTQEMPNQGSAELGASERTVAFTELLLRNLIRLYHSDVVFSVYDNLFSRWLDEVASTWLDFAANDVPLSFKSLVRLFQGHNVDSTPGGRKSRASVMLTGLPMTEEPSSTGVTSSPGSGMSTATLDPWKVLVDTSLDGSAGRRRALRWLRIIAQSGVDPSFEVFEHLESLCAAPGVPFADSVDLSEALFASAWSRSINRKAMADIAARLYTSQHAVVKASLDNNQETEITLTFMRRTLGAFLLATGTTGDNLITLGFTTASEARVLGGSRKRHSLIKPLAGEITCPSDFLEQLTQQCQSEVFVARGVIARFLYSLLAGKQALRTRDLIIKANAGVLSSCIFRLFDLNQPGLTEVRIQLLLVLLSVDGPTFHRLLGLVCKSDAWEHRFTTLDILVPAGLHQFFPVITHFFIAVWDPEEAVRQKVETLIKSLRPSHCSVMAQSLQSHFNLGNLQLLNCALLMVAEGLELDRPSTLVKIKYHALKALGFQDVSLRPSVNGGVTGVTFALVEPIVRPASLATLASLKRVLDCSKHVMTRMWSERTGNEHESANDLVGSTFLDVVPALVNSGVDLDSFTYIQIRDVLECLAISIFKHNLAGHAKLDVYEAVRRVTALLLAENTAYDNRILILLTCTSLLRKFDVVDILPHQVLVVAQMMAQRDGDALWAQGTLFLHTAFQKFATKGLFLLLFKLIPETLGTEKTFDVFSIVMRDGPSILDERNEEILLREAPFYDVRPLPSLTKFAVGFSADTSGYVQFLARLAQRTTEPDATSTEDFDPNPSVMLVLLVLRKHPQHAQGHESIQTLRTVNVVLLAELSNPSALPLLGLVPAIASAVTISLRSCLRSASQAPLSLPVVSEYVAQCFANIRLVALLATLSGDREILDAYWRMPI